MSLAHGSFEGVLCSKMIAAISARCHLRAAKLFGLVLSKVFVGSACAEVIVLEVWRAATQEGIFLFGGISWESTLAGTSKEGYQSCTLTALDSLRF